MKRDPAACLADMLDHARDAQAFVPDLIERLPILISGMSQPPAPP